MTDPTVPAPFAPRRALAYWRRNALVWRKLMVPSLLGNFIDPTLYLFGLGLGLGALIAEVDGQPYLNFLAPGIIAYATMNAASFEALYSAFSRMHVQKTWEAVLTTPLTLTDVVLGELLWAATKATLAGSAVTLVAAAAGLVAFTAIPFILPVIALTGLTFAALALPMVALAKSYDFFLYYFTLFITPMSFLSGAFFPLTQLPAPLVAFAQALPLTHAVALLRPLAAGSSPAFTTVAVAVVLMGLLTVLPTRWALRRLTRRLLP
jgi:lipooligosaccharide transport system permease protein